MSAATSRKIALGMTMADDHTITAADDFTASAGGHAPAMWTVASEWGDVGTREFPSEMAADLAARDIVPMIDWLPLDPSDFDAGGYSRYKRIVDGKHDDYIRTWAEAARDFGGRIVVRFAPEMNGHWFPWGIGRFDNTAANFKKAWRHIWRIFRGAGGVGADNVRFLWSPNKPCSGCQPGYALLYPGDSYVDYVGFSSFNWGSLKTWTPMAKGYRRAVEALDRVTNKRVIVAETGSFHKGGDKPEWILKGYPAVYRNFPRIKAIVYLNVDMRPIFDGQPDWRLTRPIEALAAYADIAARSKFQGTIP